MDANDGKKEQAELPQPCPLAGSSSTERLFPQNTGAIAQSSRSCSRSSSYSSSTINDGGEAAELVDIKPGAARDNGNTAGESTLVDSSALTESTCGGASEDSGVGTSLHSLRRGTHPVSSVASLRAAMQSRDQRIAE